MRILVTGGAGFIGSHVAEYYAKKDEEVVVFDALLRSEVLKKNAGNAFYNWNYLRDNYSNIDLVKGDVRNFKMVKEASSGVDVIVHAAAQVAVTTSLIDPLTDFEINALGTFHILEAARLNDAKVIYISTNKVYGENINKIPLKKTATRYYFADERFKDGISENFSIDQCGHSPYGCSKLSGDLYAQDYAHTYNLATGIFRMSCVYGERQFGAEDQGWVAWFIIATLTNKPITIYGDGKQVRDVLYVKDLVRIFDNFINGNLKHEVFNVGGGPENTLSLLELLDLILKLTGKKPQTTFADWRQADQKVYISDISKAKTMLNWRPEVNPIDGVKRFIEWVMKTKRLTS